MAEFNFNEAVYTDLTNEMSDFSVDSAVTDGPTGQKETTYINSNWSNQLGYYKTIPELKSVIDAKATWTVGKGYVCGKEYQGTIIEDIQNKILKDVVGFGKDTFNTILENMIRTYHIGGDAFAEIIIKPSDIKQNFAFNLKPLDPSTIKIVSNKQGIIIRYEQVEKTGKVVKKFKPEEIFHLSRNRVADEIHGQSLIDALETIILMKNQAMDDWKRVLHRNIDPLWIIHADTDDTTKIAKIKSDYEKIRKSGESWIVPKDVIIPELISTATNATLSPLQWIESLDAKFYEAAQVPKIIVGGTGAITEAAVKIAYLAFQQTIEEEQLYIEEQCYSQLKLDINLQFPASLENEMLSDKPKEEVNPPNIEQANNALEANDLTAEMEGRK